MRKDNKKKVRIETTEVNGVSKEEVILRIVLFAMCVLSFLAGSQAGWLFFLLFIGLQFPSLHKRRW